MNESRRTATSRKKLSTPMRWLLEQDLLGNCILDYGCGRGQDVQELIKKGYDAKGYDPHWGPFTFPDLQYDTITCIYVLNVIPSKVREGILATLQLLSAERIFVVVRADLKQKYIKTSWGTEQWDVHLSFPIMHETSGYRIYKVRG